MAGVKGRSGGARANAGGARMNAGGARPGAGRKRKEPAVTAITDPLEFLKAVWTGAIDATALQIRAATAALPFLHRKLGEGGKKDEASEASKKASKGKYAPSAPPRLVVDNKKP